MYSCHLTYWAYLISSSVKYILLSPDFLGTFLISLWQSHLLIPFTALTQN